MGSAAVSSSRHRAEPDLPRLRVADMGLQVESPAGSLEGLQQRRPVPLQGVAPVVRRPDRAALAAVRPLDRVEHRQVAQQAEQRPVREAAHREPQQPAALLAEALRPQRVEQLAGVQQALARYLRRQAPWRSR